MTKRIGLYLGAAPHFGGVFQYSQTLVEALNRLPRNEFDPVIGYAHPAWRPILLQYDIHSFKIPLGYWGRFFGQLLHYSHISVNIWRKVSPLFHPTVRSFIKAECDLWIFPSQDPWSYLSPEPALATIHDLMHRYERRFPEMGNSKEYAWREWHYGNTCEWSRGVLVDSDVGKNQVIESYRVSPSKVLVLPFVAPAYLDTVTATHTRGSDYNLPEKFIFYPAQFWRHKNHEFLIQAISVVKNRFNDIKLVLTGTPKNGYSVARNLVVKLGLEENVLFMGYLPNSDMGNVYRHARALVMPTFCGPTNIPPLEAMFVGCPVAASDIYATSEQTKGAALLFDPNSVESIADAISELWGNDKICLSMAAIGLEVSSQWTLVHFSDRFSDVVRSIVK